MQYFDNDSVYPRSFRVNLGLAPATQSAGRRGPLEALPGVPARVDHRAMERERGDPHEVDGEERALPSPAGNARSRPTRSASASPVIGVPEEPGRGAATAAYACLRKRAASSISAKAGLYFGPAFDAGGRAQDQAGVRTSGPPGRRTKVSSALAPGRDGFQAKAWPGRISSRVSGDATTSREA